jgi:transcriptional pleiotropic regulator of transition state genes
MQSEEHSDESARIFGGVIRRIDALGRVVIPAEQRRALGIREGDLIETRLESGRVAIVKVEPECALCGATSDLSEMYDKHVCNDCVLSLRDRTVPTRDDSHARRPPQVFNPRSRHSTDLRASNFAPSSPRAL